MTYEPAKLAAFFDDYGDREWSRFHDGRTSRLSLEIHLEYLRRYVKAGDKALDVGAGPGRFTIELARLGASVTVVDLSQTQLDLNRVRVAEAGFSDSVVERIQADVIKLSLPDASYDVTICYGGPLSYVLDRADDAVAELARVTRPAGHVIVSVMSLVGATMAGWQDVVEVSRSGDREGIRRVIETGDLPPELSHAHAPMHMFRWKELEELLVRHSLTIVGASASSISFGRHHRELEASLDEDEMAEMVRWQLGLAADPGAIGAGEHIIAVARRN